MLEMEYETIASNSFVWQSTFVLFPMFWILYNKSEQPVETLVPALELWVVVIPLVIQSGIRAALYIPKPSMREMSRWGMRVGGSGVFIDLRIDILFLGRVGITIAIKETKLFLALGNLSSATGISWLMWWGEGGGWHPSDRVTGLR